jgi:hypothetical protein
MMVVLMWQQRRARQVSQALWRSIRTAVVVVVVTIAVAVVVVVVVVMSVVAVPML